MTTSSRSPWGLGDASARARIERDLDRGLVVIAGAGTGKTTALVSRMVDLVRKKGASMSEIAAITFTESAASDLRERVRAELSSAAWANPTETALATARDETDEAAIGTIHSFARRLLAGNWFAAGLAPDFEVLDEAAERSDFELRWETFADDLMSDPLAERALLLGFATGLKMDGLEELTWSMQSNWDRLEWRRAGASGYSASPCDWAHVDATAVEDAIEKALACEEWCLNSDDLLLKHLQTTLRSALEELTAARDDEYRILQVLADGETFSFHRGQKEHWRGRSDEVRGYCAAAQCAREALLSQVRDDVLAYLVDRAAHFVLTASDDRLAEGRLSFHDLLVRTCELFGSQSGGRGAVGSGIEIVSPHKWILLDELQDVDPIQAEIALRACREGHIFAVGDPEQSIYRSRRADRSIFDRLSSRIDDGGRIELTSNFRSVPAVLDFVNALFAELFVARAPDQVQHSNLEARRRSPGGAAGRKAGRRGGRGNGSDAAAGALQLRLGLAGSSDDGEDLLTSPPQAGSRRGRAPVLVLGGPMMSSITATELRRRAAKDVAQFVRRMVGERWVVDDCGRPRPVRWADIALLIPSPLASASVEDALETSEVPYRLEDTAMLWGSEEVRDVLTVLRSVEDPADAVAVVGALRSPGLACGDDDLVTWRRAGGAWDPREPPPSAVGHHPVAGAMAIISDLAQRAASQEPSMLVRLVMDATNAFELALARRSPSDGWRRLNWLVDQARLFDDEVGGTLARFLEWAELRSRSHDGGGVGPPGPHDDCVRVMTVHGSKGLEFPVVVLAELGLDDAIPYRDPALLLDADGVAQYKAGPSMTTSGYRAARDHDRELGLLEKQRLLYVAMTRARDLVVLGVHHREVGDSGQPRKGLGALVWDFCERHPSLWRRPPLEAVVGWDDDGSPVALGQPRHASAPTVLGRGEHWVERREEWSSERQTLLRSSTKCPTLSVTTLAASKSAAGREERTRATSSTDLAVGAESERGVERALGRAVHRVLASTDLSTGLPRDGLSASELARWAAASCGVDHRCGEVTTMVDAAMKTATMREAASSPYWQEVFVAVPLSEGGSLEGYVDLLYERPDGSLVVVDFNTDPMTDAVGGENDLQVGAYAAAVERATGKAVDRCALLFFDSPPASERSIAAAALSELKRRALDEARTLMVTPGL